jgi:hypothetical protein
MRQTIKNYYNFGIGVIQKANSQMLFIIHDAFQSIYYWTSYGNANAVLDTHHYEGLNSIRHILIAVFGSTFELQAQISDVCGFGTSLAGIEGSIITVVGEFSGAQTDCTYR